MYNDVFYLCWSKKKPHRAYVVQLLYSTLNKSSMSMRGHNICFNTKNEEKSHNSPGYHEYRFLSGALHVLVS